jgi:hypothetical protein
MLGKMNSFLLLNVAAVPEKIRVGDDKVGGDGRSTSRVGTDTFAHVSC